MAEIRALGQAAKRERLAPIALAERGPLGAHEVDVEVASCSVCHSDVHLVDGDWGDVARPLVPGHEIVGRVTAKGDLVGIAIGTTVGIGWQAGACGTCGPCRTHREHLCIGGKVRTCVGRPGGFATHVRVDARFAFELPDTLDPTLAAPLLCAGLTVFSPIERLAVGSGMRVGVVGIGGLGHLAVRYAKAKGAEVIAFDPDPTKSELARSLGASDLLDARAGLPARAVDVLLVTTHADLAWNEWLEVLDLEGTLCLVGVPTKPLSLSPDPFLDGQKRLTGSVIGSPATMRRMLAFSAEHGILPVTERMKMSEANEAIARVRRGEARLRIVLEQDL